MRLKDINAEINFELWLIPELSGETPNIGIGYIAPNNTGQAYRLRIDGQQWSVQLRDPSVGKDLNFHLKRGCAHLAEVMHVAKDGSALVKIIFFNGEIVEIGDVEIGIDERIESTAKRNGIHFNGAEELGSVLNDKCKISVGGEDFFLLMSGPSAKADFEADIPEDEDSLNSKAVVQEKYREFSIYGERVRIPVERRNVDKSKDIYFATKAVFKDNQKSEGALRLARGTVLFSDYTKTDRIRALAAGAMSQLTKETGSYLQQWDEYGAIEGEMLLARAKAVGRIDYHDTEQTTKGVKFFVSSIPDQLTEGDEIEITSEEPLYLKNPDLTWESYSKALEEEFATKMDQKKNDAEMPASVYAPILKISKTSIELDLPSIPSGQMFLILSINGDKIQIERRMRARSAILEGRCANPLLGLLIEEGGTLPDIQRVTKLKPLTSFVKEKIFKHPPTDRQVEAIDVALNTPDIALIQGPPGTGKTTVVTAILERLNEEYDKTKSIRGQILVSGFQHDAVENIVARLSVNALPAVKFGRRTGDSEFTEDAVTEKINKWCSNVAENIRIKNPQIAQTEDQVRLAELFVAYSLCPSKNNTVSLMKRILDLPRDVISEDITSEAEEIIHSLQTELKSNDPSTLRLVRALRVSEAAFVDDGAARAVDLLNKIEDELANPDLSVLEKAARWRCGKPLSFLPELRELKESLLYKYLPLPDFRTEKPREDVLRLVATVSQLLEKKLNSTNKRDTILAEFLHELEDNPDGVREAIEDYNFVYAATTQQAVGKDIIRSKNKNVRDDQRTEMVRYDTVIIDEAARTSPRDLLIPMSQAEKRIILVGDHRQLPHLIDEEVARALEGGDSSGPSVDVDFVKKSMFEYLFNRLKKLEEKDGIKRTVTLDAQYRTHPILGDFASRNFYNQYNEGYRSPLAAKYFSQKLKGIEDKAAVWFDVPNSRGPEGYNKDGGKRWRSIEAEVIAEKTNTWIKSRESSAEFMQELTGDSKHAGLSFGIISFYKPQVFEVYRELEKYGITERAQDGTWQICQEYRFLENGEERLRIGTVDAFQGMEFDIVFLSMVRSQDMNALPPNIRNELDYKKKQQKLFGHLMSENRLCVSMSRQKRVLAIVGDGVLTNTQIAVDAVPALKNFYDLCLEKGVIL
ncbi:MULTISPECIES: DEAD/DEAH box helicase [Enterobacterales]|uniref:DEAD/DEAH box helicase n=1 Tax=Enterobacterales TaxID=91347 RepID=UPI00128F3311|nr:AAA domain-containing protein [Escherichia coli]MQK02301.1 AAA family ATPase [Escherichia coli]NKD97036.1 AAA family ATPase [Escherichia coli]QIG09518.1 AAA family ATPase [Escherichia coli]QIG13787.1 AAA family ATPase [Escherichia coli]HAX5245504.1 AAA family ATPase [Escherichia coli]